MSKPAARVGDLTTHGVPAAPGIGSIDVLVAGLPAWRTVMDTHVCPVPTAPPAPAPHGPEICFLGSLSVLINGQMAVRAGDSLTGAGPPNAVDPGCPSVLVGDIGFGFADPASVAAFCADFCFVVTAWSTLTPRQRRADLQSAINRQFTRAGIPPVDVAPASIAPASGQFDFRSWDLQIDSALLESSTLTRAQASKLGQTIYHEARHAEQWYSVARYRATLPEASAAGIAAQTSMPRDVAGHAMANPATTWSREHTLGATVDRSVYGSGGLHRLSVLNAVLANPSDSTAYSRYQALPEETDAFRTGELMSRCTC